VFIATGTGISPIKGFIDEFTEGILQGRHTLVFGVQTKAYACYLDEFYNLAEDHENFDFTLCLSKPEDSDFKGETGRVTDWVRKKDARFFQGKDVYLCGSPSMVKDVMKILREEKDCPSDHIFTEAY
jgi:NAD(P)H-flavin reductase